MNNLHLSIVVVVVVVDYTHSIPDLHLDCILWV